MSEQLAAWWVHTVRVETRDGDTGTGVAYRPPVDVPCWCVDRRQLVRSRDGREVVSETQLAAPLEHAARFTDGSRVTTPTGRRASVVAVAVGDSGPLGLPDHVEVSLA